MARTGDLLLAVLGRAGALESRTVAGAEAKWDFVVDAASWHGLQPLLWHRLQQRGDAGLPSDATARGLVRTAAAAVLRAEWRRGQIHEVLAALHAAGVRGVPLKGAFLAEHAYPSPALRPMSDLDLLVPKEQVVEARAAIVALGYSATASVSPSARHAAPLRRPGRLPVEIHHTIEPCTAPFTLQLDDVWNRTRRATVAGVDTPVLSPEDLLLHVSAHMAHSHVLGASLVSVCDVLAWCERFGDSADWDAVVARARSAGVRRFVYAALALAQRALYAPVPIEALESLRARPDDDLVAHAMQLLTAPPFLIIGAKGLTDPRDSFASRIRRVVNALFVAPGRRRLGRQLRDRPLAQAVGREDDLDGYASRWKSMARFLLNPVAGRMAWRHIAHVRSLRRWAAGD